MVTLVEPAMQVSITEATKTCCRLIHAVSVVDAVREANRADVQALIVSPGFVAQERLPNIASLVRKCPRTMAVAVISERRPAVEQGLLDLGGCGVRTVVDLSEREGWSSLREFVSRAGESTMRQILDLLAPSVTDLSQEMHRFVEELIRIAPTVGTVRQLARGMRLHPSSMMSRFFRAGLPAPKAYLSAARLLYAAAYFEGSGVSVANVANRLEYSSPQSFGRHIRSTMGMTAVNFRYRYSLSGMANHFVNTMVVPYRETLRTFDPYGMTLPQPHPQS